MFENRSVNIRSKINIIMRAHTPLCRRINDRQLRLSSSERKSTMAPNNIEETINFFDRSNGDNPEMWSWSRNTTVNTDADAAVERKKHRQLRCLVVNTASNTLVNVSGQF